VSICITAIKESRAGRILVVDRDPSFTNGLIGKDRALATLFAPRAYVPREE
jgi:regulator of RNase E activity RraA